MSCEHGLGESHLTCKPSGRQSFLARALIELVAAKEEFLLLLTVGVRQDEGKSAPCVFDLIWAFQQVLFELISRDCTAPSPRFDQIFRWWSVQQTQETNNQKPVSVDRSETDSDEKESPNGSFASFDRKQAEASR